MSDANSSHWPDDETLMAFADGMLEASEAEKIARYLETNEEARRFVERLIASASLAKRAYDNALNSPEPDKRLAKLIMEPGSADRSRMYAGNVTPLPPRSFRRSVARFAVPLAASVALLVGSFAGFELGRRGSGISSSPQSTVSVGLIDKSDPVAALLEHTPSGERVSVAGPSGGTGRDLLVIATFRDGQARVCREFESLATDEVAAPATMAVGCREHNGWRIIGAVQSTVPLGRDFSPAGSDGSPIDRIMKVIGAQTPLSKADEDALLAAKWR